MSARLSMMLCVNSCFTGTNRNSYDGLNVNMSAVVK